MGFIVCSVSGLSDLISQVLYLLLDNIGIIICVLYTLKSTVFIINKP